MILTHDSFAVNGSVSSSEEEEVSQKSLRSFPLQIEKMNICQTRTQKKRPAENRPVEAVHLQGKVCNAQLQVSHFRESSRSDLLHPPAPMTNPDDEKQIRI